MRAIALLKYGDPDKAFRMEEQIHPTAEADEVVIEVEAFGINFADIMARRGLYKDAPKPPFIPGYEVVGRIDEIGSEVDPDLKGQRVVGFTRFGGYSEYVKTKAIAVAKIPEDMDPAEATALGTQYCTAHYAAYQAANLRENETILIHSASGGVGVALTQLALNKNCTVIGTTTSSWKLDQLKENGVHYPIDTSNQDYPEEVVSKIGKKALDATFNPLGGKTVPKDLKLTIPGGRVVCYGGAERFGKKGGIFSTLKFILGFGFIHPGKLIMGSRSIIGVNLLRVADYKPERLQDSLNDVVALASQGRLKPSVGARFHADEIAEAHDALENKRVTGKVAVLWNK